MKDEARLRWTDADRVPRPGYLARDRIEADATLFVTEYDVASRAREAQQSTFDAKG
jgi:hypothetical protein